MRVCLPCNARQVQAMPHTSGRAKWTRGVLYASAGLAALTGLLNAWLLLNLEGGTTPSMEDAQTFDSTNALLATLTLLVMVTTVVSYLRWLHLSVKTARALGVFSETPGSAMWAWFIPFYNLVRPYEIVRDLWLNLGGAPAQKSLLKGWWAAWLISNGVSNVSGSMLSKVATTPSLLPMALIGGLAAELLSVLAAVLCIRVIADIESMLAGRRADLSALIARTDSATHA
ncbi:DUF4328 domain-containing protein [Myxococcus sp. Y35]|uniref:DUF4328 domain-containing protein n=1 Tax=Pseudomyxococcus flavus TaxID=3115648 RepID=UPI003CE6B454